MSSAWDYLSNVIAQGISRALSMGAAFASFVLFARVLGTDQLGELAFLMAFVLLTGVVAEFGTTAALSKDLAQAKDRDPQTYFGNYLVLRTILAAVAILIAIPFAVWVRPDLTDLLLVTCVAIPFVGARMFETVYQIYERPRYAIYSALFLGITQFSVAALLLLVFKVGLRGYIYGFVVVQVAYFLVSFILALKLVRPRFRIQPQMLRDIIALAAPMGMWSIFNGISTRADIFMLSYWRTTHEVGIYNAAYRLLDLATAVAATVAVPLVPVLTRKFGTDPQGMRTASARVFELTVLLSLPIPLILSFEAEPLLVLLYGEEFSESASALKVFTWLFVLLGCIYVGSAINLAAGNIQHAWWNAAIAAALNVGSNLYFIPRYGVVGAAFSSALSTTFMLVVSQLYVRVSVGNIFVPTKWVRILIAALIPYSYLLLTPDGNSARRVLIAGLIYVAAVLLLRLLPFHYLAGWKRLSIVE